MENDSEDKVEIYTQEEETTNQMIKDLSQRTEELESQSEDTHEISSCMKATLVSEDVINSMHKDDINSHDDLADPSKVDTLLQKTQKLNMTTPKSTESTVIYGVIDEIVRKMCDEHREFQIDTGSRVFRPGNINKGYHEVSVEYDSYEGSLEDIQNAANDVVAANAHVGTFNVHETDSNQLIFFFDVDWNACLMESGKEPIVESDMEKLKDEMKTLQRMMSAFKHEQMIKDKEDAETKRAMKELSDKAASLLSQNLALKGELNSRISQSDDATKKPPQKPQTEKKAVPSKVDAKQSIAAPKIANDLPPGYELIDLSGREICAKIHGLDLDKDTKTIKSFAKKIGLDKQSYLTTAILVTKYAQRLPYMMKAIDCGHDPHYAPNDVKADSMIGRAIGSGKWQALVEIARTYSAEFLELDKYRSVILQKVGTRTPEVAFQDIKHAAVAKKMIEIATDKKPVASAATSSSREKSAPSAKPKNDIDSIVHSDSTGKSEKMKNLLPKKRKLEGDEENQTTKKVRVSIPDSQPAKKVAPIDVEKVYNKSMRALVLLSMLDNTEFEDIKEERKIKETLTTEAAACWLLLSNMTNLTSHKWNAAIKSFKSESDTKAIRKWYDNPSISLLVLDKPPGYKNKISAVGPNYPGITPKIRDIFTEVLNSSPSQCPELFNERRDTIKDNDYMIKVPKGAFNETMAYYEIYWLYMECGIISMLSEITKLENATAKKFNLDFNWEKLREKKRLEIKNIFTEFNDKMEDDYDN